MACTATRFQLDGTNQNERLADALQPANVLIDDRTEQDLYDYIYQVAKEFAFYNIGGIRQGNWQKMLPGSYALLDRQSSQQPHLALLWIFIQLFKHLQQDINLLTKQHLYYYYHDFLSFIPRKGSGDQVYLQFELNRQTDTQLLPMGTRFPAGKLGDQDIYYTLDNEVVINRGVIASLKSILVDAAAENRIYAAPVANSLDGLGKKMPAPGQAWRPFGESQIGKTPISRTMIPARVGFAIASPILLLAEGVRTVTITFTVKSGDTLPYFDNAFKIVLSGQKGWLPAVSPGLTWSSQSFTLTFTLNSDFPAITPPGVLLPEDSFAGDLPIALIVLDENRSNRFFDNLKMVRVRKIDIQVKVAGLRSTCLLENDQSSLDPSRTFQPFGPLPAIGSVFTVRNPEIAGKNISGVSVQWSWKGLPPDVNAWYSAYGVDATAFKAVIRLRYDEHWDTRNFYLLQGNTVDFTYDTADGHFYTDDYQPLYKDELFSFIVSDPRIPISAFGHRDYPTLLSNALVIIASGAVTPNPPVPNPPYTPAAGDLFVGYDAWADISEVTAYQVEPFGAASIDTTQASFPLFPQWEEEAALYIGLQDLPTPSILNTLWEIAETTDMEQQPPAIQWSVLKNNVWYPLSSLEVLTDQTLGWQRTGIVSLEVMDTSDGANTLLDPTLVWIKAAVTDSPEEVKSIISVQTQVATASLPDLILPDSFDDDPLPAGTIQKMDPSMPGIKKVQQPLDSFGGRATETSDHYYIRVSERIRHKNRAICLWDYEHMVLEQFPQLFKVKCLTHADASSDLAPGSCCLLIIPGFKERNSQSNPFEPKVSLVFRNQVRDYISGYTSPHVNVYVQTPVYEQVLVDLKVKFNDGFDPGYYRGQLLTAIQKLLSPWAFEDGKDIQFENKIYKSVLWSEIELLEYVDYVADFKMYHSHEGPDTEGIGCMEIGLDFKVWEAPDSVIAQAGLLSDSDMIIGDSFVVGFETEQAVASTSRSILVSSLYHRVDILLGTETICKGAANIGIGQMIIEWDFIVAGNCVN
ncbi:MAG TPA: baseplate J/gp47 family protein [Puia sp.]|nr:baseplate J/gp47 family protein [Puia sp.]